MWEIYLYRLSLLKVNNKNTWTAFADTIQVSFIINFERI